MHILNVKVECIFYFDEQNQITPGAMVHIGLHMSKILSMQKCFARTDIEIGKKGRPELIFLRNMYLTLGAPFFVYLPFSLYVFILLYTCFSPCIYVFLFVPLSSFVYFCYFLW